MTFMTTRELKERKMGERLRAREQKWRRKEIIVGGRKERKQEVQRQLQMGKKRNR